MECITLGMDWNTLKPDYPFWVSLPIQWGQTNLYEQIPEHLLLQWVETGRIELLENLDLMTFDGSVPGIILSKTAMEISSPFLYPDVVQIGTRVHEIGEDRFVLETVLYSEMNERVQARNLATLVLYDYKLGQKLQIPDSLSAQLVSYSLGE